MPATVFMNGLLNSSALTVPGAYVNFIPPQTSLINGVPSNIAGIVGSAAWGPVNSPTLAANYADATGKFGAMQNRAHDLVTWVAAAVLQGCNNFRLVRVTDGTDTAATITVQSTCLTLTSKYTGTGANGDTMVLSAGSAANSWKATLYHQGALSPEIFDNITGTANAFWVNLAAAINNGTSAQRGPSQYFIASAGVGTTAPAAGTFTLAGGTDGASGVNTSKLVGTDGVTRTGMYALRGTGCAVAALADCGDSTSWGVQAAFGISEGILMRDATPAGDTVTAFATAIQTAGVDTPWFKALLGDWCYFVDVVNNVTRLVSPAAFELGLRAALPPHQSCLNKQLFGIAGTQRSAANSPYSAAELQALVAARGDVIANPSPGGAYFGCQTGHNTSSNPVIHMDAYTTMSDYLVASMSAGFGRWVGQLQTPSQRRRAKGTISSFLQNLKTPPTGGDGMIADFSVTLDDSNNQPSTVALGYEFATIQVQYQSVIEFFVASIQGGQSVQISRKGVQQAA